MTFNLNHKQREKLKAWCEENNAKLVAGGSSLHDLQGGAIGGRYTYTFTPTSIGTVIKVADALTQTDIDLTEYDSW